MITVRARPLQSTDRLRHAVLEGTQFRDTVDLFAGLIRALNETFADRIDELGDCLDDVEEGVLEGGHPKWRAELGGARRRIVEVKRFIDPERNALMQLVTRKLDWAEPRSMESLVQAIQILNGLGAGLEALYERAKLLQDEIAALLSEDINRKLLWLAIMSALLLPATLVTGIFGMNVAGLPGTKDPTSFWIVVGVMAGCARHHDLPVAKVAALVNHSPGPGGASTSRLPFVPIGETRPAASICSTSRAARL
ncbi:CorA family divalent cation transporter [Candidatus Burkholderia verschuerenii]|uniref:CorA family divalent cation transporter n=1 Tax=Candidatus Burkholderia verschuerenii TaxID=242163 RepID=UPI001E5277C4|nr:CorA family divalent cation transporter [Candidatus Burkholderia verschuerenii]